MPKFWAYRHSNGTIKMKIYTGDSKIDEATIADAYESPFVEDVIENIEAENIRRAFVKAVKEFKKEK